MPLPVGARPVANGRLGSSLPVVFASPAGGWLGRVSQQSALALPEWPGKERLGLARHWAEPAFLKRRCEK
jgi:hypothetical protein